MLAVAVPCAPVHDVGEVAHGWVRKLGDLLEPFVLSLYTLPKIALAPLFVLWFGIGATNKIMFAAMLVFFMVFFTTYQGTRQVDRDLVENARLLGASRWGIWTKIAVPYSAVWVFTGLRIGLPYALIGAIVGEFVAAESGVGFRIKEATSFFNTAEVFAGLIVLMAISLVLLGGLKLRKARAALVDCQRHLGPRSGGHDVITRRLLLAGTGIAATAFAARAATPVTKGISSNTLAYGGLRIAEGAGRQAARARPGDHVEHLPRLAGIHGADQSGRRQDRRRAGRAD